MECIVCFDLIPPSELRAQAHPALCCPPINRAADRRVSNLAVENGNDDGGGGGADSEAGRDGGGSQEVVAAHATCSTCTRAWIKSQLDHKILEFKCPNWECARAIPHSEVKPLLGAGSADAVALDRMVYIRSIDTNPNARWCPSPECGEPVYRTNKAERRMQCTSCNTAFCYNCGAPWTSAHAYACLGDSTDVIRWVYGPSWEMVCGSRPSRKCPCCMSRIVKEGGCNHVVCGNCRAEFCWLCVEMIDGIEDHYSNPSNRCKGMLYSDTRWRCFGGSKSGRMVQVSLRVAIIIVSGVVGGVLLLVVAVLVLFVCSVYRALVGLRCWRGGDGGDCTSSSHGTSLETPPRRSQRRQADHYDQRKPSSPALPAPPPTPTPAPALAV